MAGILWDTPWMTNLCSCNLQQHQSLDEDMRVSIWPSSGCPICHFPTPDSLTSNPDGPQPGSENLVRLVLVTCGIALCSPVSCEVMKGRTVFTYRKKEVGRDLIPRVLWRRRVGPLDLVKDVGETMDGLQDTEALSVLHSVATESGMYRYVDICGLLEADHSRLERYCTVYREHRGTQRNRQWLRSYETRFKAFSESVAVPQQPPDYLISYNSSRRDFHHNHMPSDGTGSEFDTTPKLKHRTGRIETLSSMEKA